MIRISLAGWGWPSAALAWKARRRGERGPLLQAFAAVQHHGLPGRWRFFSRAVRRRVDRLLGQRPDVSLTPGDAHLVAEAESTPCVADGHDERPIEADLD